MTDLMFFLYHLIQGARRRIRSLQLQFTLVELTVTGRFFLCSMDQQCSLAPQWWSKDQNPHFGHPLQVASPGFLLYTDVSALGWGASTLQEWSPEKVSLHSRF